MYMTSKENAANYIRASTIGSDFPSDYKEARDIESRFECGAQLKLIQVKIQVKTTLYDWLTKTIHVKLLDY